MIPRHCLVAGAGGFLCGLLALEGQARYDAWTLRSVESVASTSAEFVATREVVPFATLREGRKVMVAVVFGQSNASNVGETKRRSHARVLNFFEGQLFRAEDPLLGGDDVRGSVWTRLGDLLIEGKHFDEVVFIPIAVSGSAITRWQPGGDIHPVLMKRLEDARTNGLTITHLLWHQGETDAERHTAKKHYQQSFNAMLSSIRREGVMAPIYVSVATRCGRQRPDPIVQGAQIELVDPKQGVYAGPNTDTLGFEYRFDGCHFADAGLDAAAQLWLQALTRQPQIPLKS